MEVPLWCGPESYGPQSLGGALSFFNEECAVGLTPNARLFNSDRVAASKPSRSVSSRIISCHIARSLGAAVTPHTQLFPVTPGVCPGRAIPPGAGSHRSSTRPVSKLRPGGHTCGRPCKHRTIRRRPYREVKDRHLLSFDGFTSG